MTACNTDSGPRIAQPECDCGIPLLVGEGQHSPACAIFKCPVNAFGSTVHEFTSHLLGSKCRCGKVTWEGGPTDA